MVRPLTAQINLLSGEEPERRDEKKNIRFALEEVASSAASAMDWQLGGRPTSYHGSNATPAAPRRPRSPQTHRPPPARKSIRPSSN